MWRRSPLWLQSSKNWEHLDKSVRWESPTQHDSGQSSLTHTILDGGNDEVHLQTHLNNKVCAAAFQMTWKLGCWHFSFTFLHMINSRQIMWSEWDANSEVILPAVFTKALSLKWLSSTDCPVCIRQHKCCRLGRIKTIREVTLLQRIVFNVYNFFYGQLLASVYLVAHLLHGRIWLTSLKEQFLMQLYL